MQAIVREFPTVDAAVRLLVDLDQPLPGHRQFLSSWVHADDEVAYVVDPGPRGTVDVLLEALRTRGLGRLDYVLLTHIHLDHAGGTAEVLRAFPEARVYCHPIGVRHLTEPARLWAGSVKTLGEVATVYGQPDPVPPERFVSAEALSERHGIRVVETPGHASHHVCFWHRDTLFVGEALGIHHVLPDGSPYLRPATPPRFFPETYLASVDRLASLTPEPPRLAFAHHGEDRGLRLWCDRAREQLARWLAVARDAAARGETDLDRLADEILERDPLCGRDLVAQLPEDIQQRERHYTRNSLAGLLQAVSTP